MSRSGYSDDCDDQWAMIRWRGAVTSAIRGNRGQAFLREMLAAMDAMPDKQLIKDELVSPDGDVCAIGSVALARKMDVSNLDPDEPDEVAKAFCISPALAMEIVYENDTDLRNTPEQRFNRMRQWIISNLKQV